MTLTYVWPNAVVVVLFIVTVRVALTPADVCSPVIIRISVEEGAAAVDVISARLKLVPVELHRITEEFTELDTRTA